MSRETESRERRGESRTRDGVGPRVRTWTDGGRARWRLRGPEPLLTLPQLLEEPVAVGAGLCGALRDVFPCQRTEGLRNWRVGWEDCGRDAPSHPTPPPLTPPFSLRAFYLERSNLPTDASTTVVKIDQVASRVPRPLWSLARTGGSQVKTQQAGPRVAPGHSPDRQGFCSPSSRRSPGMAPSPFSEFQLRPRLPWNSSDDLFSLAPLTCASLVSLVYQSISLRLEPHTRCDHAVFFLFVFNLWPIFKKKKRFPVKWRLLAFLERWKDPLSRARMSRLLPEGSCLLPCSRPFMLFPGLKFGSGFGVPASGLGLGAPREVVGTASGSS